MTPEDRFMSHVDKRADGCWWWTARIDRLGYGRWERAKGITDRMAHRWAYRLFVGPIPDGLELDHLCRVRHCVAPHHLEPVTRAENLRRSPIAPSTINAAKTHCINGHEFTEANTILRNRPGGGRDCRACGAARRARKREVAA